MESALASCPGPSGRPRELAPLYVEDAEVAGFEEACAVLRWSAYAYAGVRPLNPTGRKLTLSEGEGGNASPATFFAGAMTIFSDVWCTLRSTPSLGACGSAADGAKTTVCAGKGTETETERHVHLLVLPVARRPRSKEALQLGWEKHLGELLHYSLELRNHSL